MLSILKEWARELKRDVVALYLAARDSRTPLRARLLAGFVAAYALSPVDLIPDFIPILGYLDDLVIVPAGLWFAVRMVPPGLMAEFRLRALMRSDRPRSLFAAILIATLWIMGVLAALWWLWRRI